MKHLLKVCLAVFFICITKQSPVLGQETNAYYFQQFDNRNGLSNSAVNRVFQDKDQLLCIRTWDGLNMYDGTEFRIFNHNTENHGNGIGNNVIQDIEEDKNANIWISTVGGITRFEKDTGKFYQYFTISISNEA